MKISAIVPTYNSEEFIEESIKSLCTQTHPLTEILIIDDFSTDGTLNIINKLSNRYKNIRIIENSSNLGVSATRNKGIKEALGDWLLFLDADDIAEENLVEEAIEYYLNIVHSKKENQWALVHPAYLQIDKQGKSDGTVIRGKQYEWYETLGYELYRNQIVTPSGLLIKKEIVVKYGGFDENLSYNEDWDLWLRVARDWGFAYIDKPLVRVRRHSNNATSELQKTRDAERFVLSRYNIKEIKDAIFKRKQDEDENRLNFISMLYRLDKWEEGFNEFSLLEGKVRKDKELFWKSLYYLYKNDYKEALILLREALQINPNNGAILNNLGVLYALTGNSREARILLNRAVVLYPDYLDGSNNLKLLSSNSTGDFKFTWRELRDTLLKYSKG